MKIGIILGTRPEIIKMCSIIRECKRRRLNYFILHTNQHYSKELDRIFFRELELPGAKYNLGSGSGTHAEETGRMLVGIEKILIKEKPDVILVEGDTNTVLAGALAAVKLGIKIGHVEAGLRSYFRGMPEEINRILADNCADMLFAPTEKSKKILLKEDMRKSRIFVTGNTIVDAVIQNMKLAKKKSKVMAQLRLKKEAFFLVTAHRAENVDVRERLSGILKGLELVSGKYGFPVVYPLHPRTRKRLREFGIKVPEGIRMIDPVGYFDFLVLMEGAKLVLTDSGGVQEESCVLSVPCVTLRDNTERPETIDVGSNMLAGVKPSAILRCVNLMLGKKNNWKKPFGNGTAGKKIIEIVKMKCGRRN